MDKKMTFIFGTAFVLIVLFFVYILVPKDFSNKNEVDNNSVKNNNQATSTENKIIENTQQLAVTKTQEDLVSSTTLDLSAVTMENIDEEITTEDILDIYEVSGPTGKTLIKMPQHRTIVLSSDKRFVVMDSESNDFAFRLFDTATGKFLNKMSLKTEEDKNKDHGLYWWSPDGKYLAFTMAGGSTMADLVIYDIYNNRYKNILTSSFMMCADRCISEVPFWSLDSKYIAIVEHGRDNFGDYTHTSISVYDLAGNRVVESEQIHLGDTSTMFRLAWDENNKLTYSYLSYTEDGEEFVLDQPVLLDYNKLK